MAKKLAEKKRGNNLKVDMKKSFGDFSLFGEGLIVLGAIYFARFLDSVLVQSLQKTSIFWFFGALGILFALVGIKVKRKEFGVCFWISSAVTVILFFAGVFYPTVVLQF